MDDFKKVLFSIAIAFFIYFFILVCHKIMGRRERNELSIFDFCINVIIGNIAASAIVQHELFIDDVFAVMTLVALQVIVAKIALRFPKVRTKINGEPILIVMDGVINYSVLKEHRLSLDEVHMLLRGSEVADIRDIQYGIIEHNGEMSLFQNDSPLSIFPLPLIVSGAVKIGALKGLDKDEDWLNRHLYYYDIHDYSNIQMLFYEEPDKNDKNNKKGKFIVYSKLKDEVIELPLKN